jgi:hypothetical protein
MALPVTVYRSSDPGAPVFENTMSSMLNILRKCLVDGYGTKLPLGWLIPFEDIALHKYILYSPYCNNGQGGYCQLEASAPGNDSSFYMLITAASSATGINGLLNKQKIRSCFINTNSSNDWVLIGTSRGFYFQRLINGSLTHVGNSQYGGALFIGDIDSHHHADVGCFTAMYNPNTSDDISPSSSEGVNLLYDGYYAGMLLDTDGINSGLIYTIKYLHSMNTGDNQAYTVAPDDPNITFTFIEPLIYVYSGSSDDRDGFSVFVSTKSPFLRGKLPGMITPCIGLCRDLSYPYVFENAGVQYYPLVSSNGASAWINTVSWYND